METTGSITLRHHSIWSVTGKFVSPEKLVFNPSAARDGIFRVHHR
jgi:hypothetical protein